MIELFGVAGVVSPHKGQLNPYYLGYKIFEDIEKRWDNPTKEEREKFGRRGDDFWFSSPFLQGEKYRACPSHGAPASKWKRGHALT